MMLLSSTAAFVLLVHLAIVDNLASNLGGKRFFLENIRDSGRNKNTRTHFMWSNIQAFRMHSVVKRLETRFIAFFRMGYDLKVIQIDSVWLESGEALLNCILRIARDNAVTACQSGLEAAIWTATFAYFPGYIKSFTLCFML